MSDTKKEGGERVLERHRVREGLEEMVLSGRYPPGAKLVQDELAGNFGVARGVVREALLELQASGLVHTVDNRGVFVSDLTGETFIEVYAMSEVLEGLAARQCCDHCTRAQIRELKQQVQEIYTLGAQRRFEEMADLDRAFHRRVLELSGNKMLVQTTRRFQVLRKTLRPVRNLQRVREEHQSSLKAIERNDPLEAERLMRRHLAGSREFIEDQIATGAFVPTWLKSPEDRDGHMTYLFEDKDSTETQADLAP